MISSEGGACAVRPYPLDKKLTKKLQVSCENETPLAFFDTKAVHYGKEHFSL